MKEKWIHSGTTSGEIAEREYKNARLARRAAEESIVLLKNDGLLPFQITKKTALLGCGAEMTVKGGIGSGDVNNRYQVSIYQAARECGTPVVSEEWIFDYRNTYKAARENWKKFVLEQAKLVENPFDAYSVNPFVMPEGRPVEEKDVKDAELAVYVISRISGEGSDRRKDKGDYYLSDREQEDLSFLNKQQIPTVLIINAGGPVELTKVLEEMPQVKAVLNISQLGQEGGYAVWDVLTGRVNPSGKLTTTWARSYEDYPSAESFGYLKGDVTKEEYKEGIFVGYRHFEHVGIKPLFGFGHGLSYTDFNYECKHVGWTEKTGCEVKVLVANTGCMYPGKATVQVYVSFPGTEIEREERRLAGFAKTRLLLPAESEELSIRIDAKTFAYFSESEHVWKIDSGIYGIWIGDSLENAVQAGEVVIGETCCHNAAGNQTAVEQHAAADSKEDEAEELVGRIPIEKLMPLLYGYISDGASTLGAAGIRVPGSAGETTAELEMEYGIRSMIFADGPAGIRLHQSYEVDRNTDQVYGKSVLGALENGFLEPEVHHENADTYFQYCTAFPVGTALAQTWNPCLMYEVGQGVALEMQEFHVDLWLAPGMNIHRNPLCGRNFEYYSEDPLLSGKLAAAITGGVQSRPGCGVTIKHFACNNQEDNRMGIDIHVSERALREIYLRGFEIAVKESKPLAIMTSYNLINGIHTANRRDLCTDIARGEWGFDGMIMSDWSTTAPEDGSIPWKCIKAGNDLIMPGSRKDESDIRDAFLQGDLTEEDIRLCAARIVRTIRRLDQ